MYELRYDNKPVIECHRANRPVRIAGRREAFRTARDYASSVWHFSKDREGNRPRAGFVTFTLFCITGTAALGYGVTLSRVG